MKTLIEKINIAESTQENSQHATDVPRENSPEREISIHSSKEDESEEDEHFSWLDGNFSLLNSKSFNSFLNDDENSPENLIDDENFLNFQETPILEVNSPETSIDETIFLEFLQNQNDPNHHSSSDDIIMLLKIKRGGFLSFNELNGFGEI